MENAQTMIGIFEDRSHAQNAVRELKQAGFTEREIGVTARDGDPETSAKRIQGDGETHAKEGAVTGLGAGAGVGALWGLGVLAGVVPAIGPAIAGGTLAALLSSAAAGAATAGLAGTLIGLGIPEKEARYYDEEFRSGRTLVTVQADGRMEEARSILQRCGGYDMRSQRTHDEARAAGTLADRRAREAREEDLQARKRPVQAGEAPQPRR